MLDEEIEKAQRRVRTDAYQISIGELVNMYRDGELFINPDFQRLFRWEIGQKSKLIESLLLGIPLPSIFVFEKEDAKWELIDGLQRLSTILEFMGLLNDPDNGKPRPPSSLVATKYLPSLNNTVWEKSDKIIDVEEAEQVPLPSPQKLAIRRARISVEILKRFSDNDTKYDLFQRLNAGGTSANPQELRNCIIIMVNPKYNKFMRKLSKDTAFLTVLNASEEQLEKQRNMEYVTRFLVHRYVPYDGKLDIEEYMNEGIIKLASGRDSGGAEKTFLGTFSLLEKACGSDALKRIVGGKPSGRVGLVALECIAVGIAFNLDAILKRAKPEQYVRSRIEAFWKSPRLTAFVAPGLRGTFRIQRTVPFGKAWFAK